MRGSSAPSVSQEVVDAGLGARLLVDGLYDHRAIERRTRRTVRQRLARQRTGYEDGIGRDPADMDLPGRAVDDLGGGGNEYAHRHDGALADDHPLDDFGARPDEAIVLDDRRVGLQRLQHAANPDAARKMDVLADLRAGADGDPSVDHRLGIDIGAQVDEARHQDRVACDERRASHDAAGDRAKAGFRESASVPAYEFRGNLVPPGSSARTALDDLIVAEAER